MKKRRMLIFMAIFILIAIVVGCAIVARTRLSADTNNESLNNTNDSIWQFADGDVGDAGGYEINTDTMRCYVIVDGEYKCSYFESYDSGRKIEFYAGPTEMVIVDTNNGVSRCYRETYDDINQTYTNPLKRIYGDLQDMNFVHVGSDNNQHVYEGTKTVQRIDQEQIKYDVHTITMGWIDGNTYVYRYYEYADGSTLISAEAPSEINPHLVKDTKWVVDLNELCVRNTETDEKVNINVLNVSTGEAVSPSGGNSSMTEHKFVIRAHVGTKSREIEKLSYIGDSGTINVNVLHFVNIVKPEITEDMEAIDHSELQGALAMIYMLESII